MSDESGPLSREIPSSSIRKANKEVSKLLEASSAGKRTPCLKVPRTKKADIAKYAAEHDIFSVMVNFAPDYPDLKESMVAMWLENNLS